MAIYDMVNQQTGQRYYEEPGTNNGRPGHYNVYEDGRKVFVALPQSSVAPPPPPPAPPAPAPAPVAAAPAPVTSSNPGSTGGTASTGAPSGFPDYNPANHEYYRKQQTTDNGVPGTLHVYQNGHTEFVAAAPTGGISTGGVPGVPTAPGLGNPAPAAAAPTFNNSSPQPITGSGIGSQVGSAVSTGVSAINTASTAAPSGGGQSQLSGYGTPPPTPTAAGTGGLTHTVAHGDTLSSIAKENGVSLSQLESLNPQIKNPSLIFPGQTVNLGAGKTTPAVAGGTAVAADPSFPTSSSYQMSGSGPDEKSSVKLSNFGDKQSGWGTGDVPADPAKGVVSVDTHQSTDPLHGSDKNNKA